MSAMFRTPFPTAVASGRLISEVLRLADVQEDLGGGRIRMRLSKARLKQPEVKAALGEDVKRAAELAVVYDEREAEVVDVAADTQSWEDELYAFVKRSNAGRWNSYAHQRKRRHPERFGIWS